MSLSRHLASLFISLSLAASLASAGDCRAILDAGSSGTRLYVYEDQDGKWVEHEGPKVGALADPIRQIRGKTWRDVMGVAAEVVNTLEKIKTDGPVDAKGKPKWKGFDWSKACSLRSVSIYATAGMRIAEQEKPKQSAQVWDLLSKVLANRLGKDVQVQAKTLSGFEEGLFAWMTLNAGGHGKDFGIIEMGGASAQVTFPCADCEESRPVLIDGAPLKMFSYSYLGLGGDEAVNTLGMQPVCAFAAAKNDPTWNAQRCADTMNLKTAQGFVDPYNFGAQGRGTVKQMPRQLSGVPRWYATGAFSYMADNDVDACCVQGSDKCFQPETSCFRSVYYRKYIQDLGIPAYEKASTSWTLGAMLCDRNNCLAQVPQRECHWMKDGCLVN